MHMKLLHDIKLINKLIEKHVIKLVIGLNVLSFTSMVKKPDHQLHK